MPPVFGLLGGAVAGPELCGLADTVLRGLRDELGFWWKTYRRAWVRSAGASVLPGALGGGLLATQVFFLFHAGALKISTATGAALAAGILLVLAVTLLPLTSLWLPALPALFLIYPGINETFRIEETLGGSGSWPL